MRKTAQNAKFLRCAKTRKTAQNSAKCEIFAKRKTAQNAQNFGFAAQNSAKSAEFGRAKTAQKQSAKLHNAHPCLRVLKLSLSGDKLYEKRKAAALEVEVRARNAIINNNTS